MVSDASSKASTWDDLLVLPKIATAAPIATQEVATGEPPARGGAARQELRVADAPTDGKQQVSTESTASGAKSRSAGPRFAEMTLPRPSVWHDYGLLGGDLRAPARCSRVAICNQELESVQRFECGETLHAFVEVVVQSPQRALCCQLSFSGETGATVAQRTLILTGENGQAFMSGQRVYAHVEIPLQLSAGMWCLEVTVATASSQMGEMLTGELAGNVGHFAAKDILCTLRAMQQAFYIAPATAPAASTTLQIADADECPLKPAKLDTQDIPTLYHVSHEGAGCQWVATMLAKLFPGQTHGPHLANMNFRKSPRQAGVIYTGLNLTSDEFRKLQPARNAKIAVVIRDLRDTLVALYLDALNGSKVDHDPGLAAMLSDMSLEDGLLHMLDVRLPAIAMLQSSWIEMGATLYSFEELVVATGRIMHDMVARQLGVKLDTSVVNAAVTASATSQPVLADGLKGRSNRRLWEVYFTPRVVDAFKRRYGHQLLSTGYESNDQWFVRSKADVSLLFGAIDVSLTSDEEEEVVPVLKLPRFRMAA